MGTTPRPSEAPPLGGCDFTSSYQAVSATGNGRNAAQPEWRPVSGGLQLVAETWPSPSATGTTYGTCFWWRPWKVPIPLNSAPWQ